MPRFSLAAERRQPFLNKLDVTRGCIRGLPAGKCGTVLGFGLEYLGLLGLSRSRIARIAMPASRSVRFFRMMVDLAGGLGWWTWLVDLAGGLGWWTWLVDLAGGLGLVALNRIAGVFGA
jgi:hypothetical protein